MENGPFEDVFEIEHGDFPMPYLFFEGYFVLYLFIAWMLFVVIELFSCFMETTSTVYRLPIIFHGLGSHQIFGNYRNSHLKKLKRIFPTTKGHTLLVIEQRNKEDELVTGILVFQSYQTWWSAFGPPNTKHLLRRPLYSPNISWQGITGGFWKTTTS